MDYLFLWDFFNCGKKIKNEKKWREILGTLSLNETLSLMKQDHRIGHIWGEIGCNFFIEIMLFTMFVKLDLLRGWWGTFLVVQPSVAPRLDVLL